MQSIIKEKKPISWGPLQQTLFVSLYISKNKRYPEISLLANIENYKYNNQKHNYTIVLSDLFIGYLFLTYFKQQW